MSLSVQLLRRSDRAAFVVPSGFSFTEIRWFSQAEIASFNDQIVAAGTRGKEQGFQAGAWRLHN